MANKTELEIVIKTAAETRGITITDQEVKKLTASLEKAAEASAAVDGSADGLAKQFGEANRKAQEFGNSLKGLSEDQLAKVRDRLREQIQEQQLAGSSADELRKKLADTYGPRTTEQIEAMTGSLGRATTATTGLEKAKGALSTAAGRTSQAMGGLNRALGGLTQGGFGGLTNVVGGLNTAFKALGVSVLRAAGPIGAAYGIISAAIGVMKKAADDNEKALTKMWEEAEASAKRYKDTLDGLNKASEENQKRQLQNLDELSRKYDALSEARDGGNARLGRDTERQKKLDLANASTPEERAAVEARYAGAERSSRREQASLTINTAESTLTDLREQRRDIEAGRAAAQELADNTKAQAQAVAARGQDARKTLTDAKAAYENAVRSMGTNFEVSAEEFAKIKADLEQAKIEVEQRAKEETEATDAAQAAADALKQANADADEALRQLEAKMERVRQIAEAASEEIKDIDVDEQVANIEAAKAAAPAPSGETAPAKEAAGSTPAAKERPASASSGPRTTMAPVEEADRQIAALEGELDTVRTASNRRFAPGVGREEVANLESQLATAREERSRLYSVVASSMEHESRELRKTQRQLKNTREKSQP